jgi:5'-hydroxyaverantin dehydrogenase
MSSSSELPSTFYSTRPIDFAKEVDTSNVKDKSVIVTGGANGIGAGCATAFAEAGLVCSTGGCKCRISHDAPAEPT